MINVKLDSQSPSLVGDSYQIENRLQQMIGSIHSKSPSIGGFRGRRSVASKNQLGIRGLQDWLPSNDSSLHCAMPNRQENLTPCG
jgi:hypothetical protein